jgi:hypothetical protein
MMRLERRPNNSPFRRWSDSMAWGEEWFSWCGWIAAAPDVPMLKRWIKTEPNPIGAVDLFKPVWKERKMPPRVPLVGVSSHGAPPPFGARPAPERTLELKRGPRSFSSGMPPRSKIHGTQERSPSCHRRCADSWSAVESFFAQP